MVSIMEMMFIIIEPIHLHAVCGLQSFSVATVLISLLVVIGLMLVPALI